GPLLSPLRSDLLGHLAGVDEAHELVAEIGGRPEHAGAAAVDHGDSVRAAGRGGGIGDAAGAGAAVQPDGLDLERGAFTHRLLGDFRPGSDHDGLDAARDRPQVVVGDVAFDLVRVGVDREHLVAALAQTLVDGVAAVVLRLPRHARHGDTL